jgi:hypothetical protein
MPFRASDCNRRHEPRRNQLLASDGGKPLSTAAPQSCGSFFLHAAVHEPELRYRCRFSEHILFSDNNHFPVGDQSLSLCVNAKTPDIPLMKTQGQKKLIS